MDLYREEILEYYKHPVNFGRPKDYDIKIKETNASCGDEITLYFTFGSDNQLNHIKFDGHGCAISVASTSMLTEVMLGKNKQQLKKLKLDDVYKLLGGPVNASRVKCATIALKAIEKL